MNEEKEIKARCPNVECKSGEMKKMVSYHDASKHIDGLSGYDLECQQCGQRFLEWNCPIEMVKKAYDVAYEQYI